MVKKNRNKAEKYQVKATPDALFLSNAQVDWRRASAHSPSPPFAALWPKPSQARENTWQDKLFRYRGPAEEPRRSAGNVWGWDGSIAGLDVATDPPNAAFAHGGSGGAGQPRRRGKGGRRKQQRIVEQLHTALSDAKRFVEILLDKKTEIGRCPRFCGEESRLGEARRRFMLK